MRPPYPNNFSYKVIEVLDSPAVNLHRYFDDAVEFIKQGNNNGKVFVHCHAGISRSSSCVIAFLMKEKGQSYQSALYQVRLKRPIVCPNVGFQKQLMDYQQQIRFESDQFAMPKSSNNQSRDKQLNQLTGGHMVIGERSHSLATTYQLQQEKLKQQKQAQEETKVDFSHIKSQSLYGQQNIGLDQARKEFLTTGNPMMINSLGVKPKTSNDLNDPRKEPMQKRQQSQFEIAGISFLQSNSNTQEIKNKNNLEVNKSQLGNIQNIQKIQMHTKLQIRKDFYPNYKNQEGPLFKYILVSVKNIQICFSIQSYYYNKQISNLIQLNLPHFYVIKVSQLIQYPEQIKPNSKFLFINEQQHNPSDYENERSFPIIECKQLSHIISHLLIFLSIDFFNNIQQHLIVSLEASSWSKQQSMLLEMQNSFIQQN